MWYVFVFNVIIQNYIVYLYIHVTVLLMHPMNMKY